MVPTRPASNLLEVVREGPVTVARIIVPVLQDQATIEALARQIYVLADFVGKDGLLVLNFGAVDYMGSSMLGKLLGLRKKQRVAGGSLALCQVRPHIKEKIFKVLHLDLIFNMYEDEPSAIEAFARLNAV